MEIVCLLAEAEVRCEEETLTLEHALVVRIAPLGETVWGRIDGSLDLGFS